MAKELPFFKFEPNQWENGNIQMCSFEAQGIFMNVCSMYWQRLGDLPYKLAVQKICKGNATAFDSLIQDDVIKVIDGMICIDFLNEQLLECGNVSKVNSENARLGWEKRRKEAKAMRPHSEPNAIREDKRREDKKREENKIHSSTFVDSGVVKNITLSERSSNFRLEVLEFGKYTYTPQMLENFIGHWSQPIGAKKLKMKFEKERDSKGWDLNLRLKKWASNNFDKIPCYLTEIKSIQQKKGEFKELLSAFKEKYKSDTLNGFYRHWTQPENKPNPVKLRWEDEEHWDMGARLKTWSESSFNKKAEEEAYKIPQ